MGSTRAWNELFYLKPMQTNVDSAKACVGWEVVPLSKYWNLYGSLSLYLTRFRYEVIDRIWIHLNSFTQKFDINHANKWFNEFSLVRYNILDYIGNEIVET